ncbi:branched-chain amino acid permease [Synergistales bacterium]|nr:branched-chain amino acid permease [Synergistales bacterium]
MQSAFWPSAKKGLIWSVPVLLGCAPIGMAYGLLSRQAGIGVWHTLAMSLFIFAGSSQFVAVSMLQNGMGAPAIIGSVFIVNFRHVLMSASLSPYLTPWKTAWRVALGGMLTDESFALHSLHFSGGDTDPIAALTLNMAMYVVWSTTGVVGYYLGALINRPEVFGLDFALPAMFIALLFPYCVKSSSILAALSGGVVSVALHVAGVGSWAAFIGGLAGATAGVFLKDDMEVKAK